MRFLNEEAEQIALEVIRAVVSRLAEVDTASRAPLSDHDATRIYQLQDRLVGLRYCLETATEQLAAVLRLTVESDA